MGKSITKARKGASGRRHLLIGALIASVVGLAGEADAYLPAVKIGTAPLIDPATANTFYNAQPNANVHTDQLSVYTLTPTARPVELVELARALKYDPNLIYEYVHNNIDVIWLYGLQKGALGAAIDKSGTPFDQAILLGELLKQVPNATVAYQAGTITLTETSSSHPFYDWTGITSARAACQLLSSGGIPARVNNSTLADCSYGAAAVSSVSMSHIWVSVTINGSTYLLDPSFKKYNWKSRIDLAAATGLTSGTPLSQAAGGMDSGTTSGASYVHNLNSEALNNTLKSYASNLLNYLQTHNLPDKNTQQTTPMSAGKLNDIVGGGEIEPYIAQVNGVPPAALPYGATPSQSPWTSGIPDPYRTRLTVGAAMQNANEVVSGGFAYDTAFNVPLFVDEIYGRRLVIDTDLGTYNVCQQSSGTGCQNTVSLKLDDQVLVAHTNPAIYFGANEYPAWCTANDEALRAFCGQLWHAYSYASSRGLPATVTLDAHHPYAAASGEYMHVAVTKPVYLVTPLTIVHGWGDTSGNLLKKWSDEVLSDKLAPALPPTQGAGGETITSHLSATQGDFNRVKTAASYQAQFTQQAHLNAAIAESLVQIHHLLGVVYSDSNINPAYVNTAVGGTHSIKYGDPNFTVSDSFDRIDVDAGYSLTSKTADTLARRAGVQAIASSGAALEGSISQQMADLPDTSSTATRFGWGNRPPSTEDPSGAGPRSFFQFDSSNASAATNVLKIEAQPQATCSEHLDEFRLLASNFNTPCPGADYKSPVAAEIAAYAQAGFQIVASQETFLGPGQRGGGNWPGPMGTYQYLPSKQRGGAFVATRYENGEPVEIAHIVSGLNPSGSPVFTKGGGGGNQGNQAASYNPSEAADILKSRFVDRSNALGVNLSNGSLSLTSPVALRVGNGGFPYELAAKMEWNSAPPNVTTGPAVPTQPQPGWTASWTNNLSMSSSGTEAMGATDVRAAVDTIAAFFATQDIYKSSQSTSRDVAGVLAQSWWVNRISGNSVTVRVGSTTRQFVRTSAAVPSQPDQWIAPGASGYATLTQTGTRTAYNEICDSKVPYAGSRGWDYSTMSFDVRNGTGDVQHFSYWRNDYWTSTQSQCGVLKGFRLTGWTFPQGVSISLTYGQPFNPYPGDGSAQGSIEQLIQVSNSVGRVINFSSGGKDINGFNNNFPVSDPNRRSVSIARPIVNGVKRTTITDQANATWTYVPSTQTLLRPYMPMLIGKVFSPLNNTTPVVQYVYDNLGRVKEVDDANRLQLSNRNPYYFFIADGTRGERVDPMNASYVVVYNTDLRPWRFIDELNRETRANYDGRGRIASYVYPELDCEQLGYDERNNPTSLLKVDKASGCNKNAAGHVLSVSATWDQTWNKPLTVVDAKSQTTTLTYFNSGAGTSLLHAATRPNGATYSFTYNSIGKTLTSTDPTNLVTLNTYDPSNANLLTTTVNPGAAQPNETAMSAFSYDAQGDVIATNGPRTDVDDTSYATFDKNRRPVWKVGVDPDGAGPHPRVATETTYDAEGRVIQTRTGETSDPAVSTFDNQLTILTTYDPVGNKTKVTTPTSVTQFSYDGDDRSLCTAVRMNRDANRVFGTLPLDACAQSSATTFGPDRITKNIYDPAGQLRQIVRALGVVGQQQIYASYRYSDNGKQKVVADADYMSGTSVGVEFTDPAHLDWNTAGAHKTLYFYDDFDRLRTTLFSDNTYEQLTYDPNGNILTKRNRMAQMIGNTYDSVNQLCRKVVLGAPLATCNASPPAAPAVTTSLNYDLAGRLLAQSDTLGNVQTNTLGSMKRVASTTVTIPGLAATKTVSYDYDSASNRLRLTWPDTYYVTYAYDAANKMLNAKERGTAPLADYDFDDLGHPAWVQYAGSGAKVSYSWTPEGDLVTLSHAKTPQNRYVDYTNDYTPAHQIASAGISAAAFQYVPLSTVNDSYTTNGLNQYTGINNGPANSTDCLSNTKQIGYDCNGNLKGDGVYSFTYDPENRLMQAAASSLNVSAQYAYDPNGRRTKKAVTGQQTVYYLSSGDDEIAEYNTNGTTDVVVNRYVPGPGIDQPIAMIACSGTNCTTAVKSFFHQDKTGSVIAMSNTSGDLVTGEGPYTYDEYGRCVVGGVECQGGVPYKYTSRRYDSETHLYYYRARYYSPNLGRFLQTDPVGYKDDINWYAYVGNDPTDKTDPTGLMRQPDWKEPNCGYSGCQAEMRNEQLCGNPFGCSGAQFAGPVASRPSLDGIPQVRRNNCVGSVGEMCRARDLLSKGYRVFLHVLFEDPATGDQSFVDIVAYKDYRRGNQTLRVYTFEEIKTGRGRMNSRQIHVMQAINRGTAIPRGPNAANAGLLPGRSLHDQGFPPNMLPLTESTPP